MPDDRMGRGNSGRGAYRDVPSPALQYKRINDALSRLPGAAAVEVALDFHWIFIRRKEGFSAFKARRDLGKWILRMPPDPEALVARAIELLPLIVSGGLRLAKYTNLSTPGTGGPDDPPKVVAYCPEDEREALGRLVRPIFGPDLYWKTNRQTFEEMRGKVR